jgi:ABC-type transport system involved in multi-copper enzyme maturation permease subunit
VRSLALIAANFIRQHRWPVVLLFVWIVITAGAAGDFGRSRVAASDVVFHAQQQSIYICIFSAFLAADAIHSERKSRRILLLLSKAISRGEYLLAIMGAVMSLAAIYAVLSALCGAWLCRLAMLPSVRLWWLCVLVIAAALISATVTMFFATFLNPYMATALALTIFCAPIGVHAHRHSWSVWWPGFPLFVQFLKFNFQGDWSPSWTAVLAAVLQSVVFWRLATIVFERRDIAMPVE